MISSMNERHHNHHYAHEQTQQSQHPMFGRPLPPLAPPNQSTPTLPMRLPSLSRAAAAASDRTPPSPVSSDPHSIASSPASSPAATLSGMKRLRVESLTSASVHPSALLSAATASIEGYTDDVDDQRSVKSEGSPKKRRPRAADSDDVFISGAYKAQRKPALNATHELRALRHDAAQMEYQIQTLRAHWRSSLPDPSVLLRACEAAKSKWITSQAEELNRQLKEQLLQQQLYLASLQNLVLQSPFFETSRSKEVFSAMHARVTLDEALNEKQRREQLRAHCELGVRMAPSLMDRFVRQHVDKATVEAPFSHSSIMCDGEFTYSSNLLVCRIPHASLAAVADAVAVYFATLQREVREHAGLSSEFKFIEQLSESSTYAQLRYQNGPEFTAAMNTTFSMHVGDDRAVVVTDFVDDDALFPLRRPGDGSTMRDSCVSLVLTPTADAHSGQPQILLQRVTILRYNLPPNARLVHHDLKTTQQWMNGDLLLKVICQELHQQLRQVVQR